MTRSLKSMSYCLKIYVLNLRMYQFIFFFLIVFIIIYIISLFIKYEEDFTNNFDKILDNKCKTISSDRFNNYIGPWDNGAHGYCGEYRCPTETCYFLEKDASISPQYGNNNYKWSSETTEQIMTTDTNGDIHCSSKHGTSHPVHGTTYDCENTHINDINHGRKDVCYEYSRNDNRWLKYTYINLLQPDGQYYWRQIGDLTITSNVDYISGCYKEPPVNCSLCNVYCCQIPGHPEPCLFRQPTTNDKEMLYEIDPTNPTTCRELGPDMCEVNGCFTHPEYKKNCWQFNRADREWTNRVFTRKFHNGKCDFYDNENTLFSEDLYINGFCKNFEATDIMTKEKCAKENSPITCKFMNDNEDVYSKTYFSTLNFRGDECIYETETGGDVLLDGFYRHNGELYEYPAQLGSNALCPVLTPGNCKNKEHYLRVYDESRNASPECLPCPEGTYRNNEILAWHPIDACTSNATCPTITDCKNNPDDKNCVQCLKPLDELDNKFEIIFLETRANKSNCEIINDSNCARNLDDNSYKTCLNPPVTFGNTLNSTKFCDNCPKSPVEFRLDNTPDGVECKRVIDCPYQENLCLNHDDYFSLFRYENETDVFSPCVWKEKVNEANIKTECITECDETNGFFKTDDGDGLYCSAVINNATLVF